MTPRRPTLPLRHPSPLGALLLVLWACGPSAGPVDPPPVARTMLLIVADDLGYGDLGCYGAPVLRTPRLDRLASEGARCTSFYANAPVCSPSRASMLSGLFPAQTGVLGAILPRAREVDRGRLRRDLTLLPQRLAAAGWRTHLVGKWHLGYEAGDLPRERGFEEFAGYHQGASYDTGRRVALERNGEPWAAEGLLTRVLADEAIAVLEGAGSDPLFLMLSFKAPHESLEDAAPFVAETVAAYRARGAGPREALYFALVEELDRQVGRVLDALERLERSSDAVVVFVSDNGPNPVTRGASSGSLRDGKGSLLEGGVRVPALVRWPGRVPGGSVVEAPTAGCDLFPTLLRAAGLQPPVTNGGAAVEGLDLLDAVRGRDRAFHERELFFFVSNHVALRQGPWKVWAALDGVRLGDWEAAARAAADAPLELFDLRSANPERRSRAAAEPAVVERLRARLHARLRAAGR